MHDFLETKKIGNQSHFEHSYCPNENFHRSVMKLSGNNTAETPTTGFFVLVKGQDANELQFSAGMHFYTV